MRCTRFLPALGCIAIALLAAPTNASAALKAIWGPVNFDGGAPVFPLYERLGVDVYQLAVDWSEVAPSKPANPRDPADRAYRWPGSIDQAVEAGDEHGVNIALAVSGTPGWANGGRERSWAPKRDRDYADFLVAIKRRYPSVRLWIIWVEPTAEGGFNPMPINRPTGPRRYAQLLDAAYGALKKEGAENTVIGANTFTSGRVRPADFVRWMRLPNGRPPRLDWYGHNPFSRRFPRLSDPPISPTARDFSDLDTLAREVRSAYRPIGKRPKLWISEWTVQTDGPSETFRFFVSRAEQAHWLDAAYEIADRKRDLIAGLAWASLIDSPACPGCPIANWGLMALDGTPKPALLRFQIAPSRRYAPTVTAPSRASRAQLRRGLRIEVTPRFSGTVSAELGAADGSAVASAAVPAEADRRAALVLKADVSAARYKLTVRAKAGERVVRRLVVR